MSVLQLGMSDEQRRIQIPSYLCLILKLVRKPETSFLVKSIRQDSQHTFEAQAAQKREILALGKTAAVHET